MIINVVLILTLKAVTYYLLIYIRTAIIGRGEGEIEHVAHSIVLTVLSPVQDFKFCFSRSVLPVKAPLCLLVITIQACHFRCK